MHFRSRIINGYGREIAESGDNIGQTELKFLWLPLTEFSGILASSHTGVVYFSNSNTSLEFVGYVRGFIYGINIFILVLGLKIKFQILATLREMRT